MSGSTRIVVIPLKKLIIMVCVIAALIILAAIFIFGGSSSDAAKSTGVNISTSTDTVKKNGGDIILVDTNKEGTTFKLIIPTKITHTTDKVVEYLS
jgi:sensor histidine kinase regulating citrate/malate metabolism